jgi:hypothetical protein
MPTEEESRLDGERCLRCMQPIPAKAKRCPNCRTPRPGSGRGLSIFWGVVGLAALLFLLIVMVQTMRNEDSRSGQSDSVGAPSQTNKAPR